MTLNAYLTNNIKEIHDALENTNLQPLFEAQSLLVNTITSGNKIFIAGNGGSAADAQHFAAELVARFEVERQSIPAEALTTDTSVLTAIANDYSFEEIFSRQLEGKANKDDLFIAISTSGNSPNILKALKHCKKHHINSVLLTGAKPSKGEQLASVTFKAMSMRTSTVQTVHQVLYHSICEFIEKEIL